MQYLKMTVLIELGRGAKAIVANIEVYGGEYS